MAEHESVPRAELKRIGRLRSWIVLESLLMLLVVVAALFSGSQQAFIAVLAGTMIFLGIARKRYSALGKRRDQLLDDLPGADHP